MTTPTKCSAKTQRGTPCKFKARYAGYCRKHAAMQKLKKEWSEHPIWTIVRIFLMVAGLVLGGYKVWITPIPPVDEMEELTERIMASSSYRERMAFGSIYNRQPLPEEMAVDLQRLSELRQSDGLLYTKAAVPLSYYYCWMQEYDRTVEEVRSGLEVIEDPSSILDLYCAGTCAVIGGRLMPEYVTAKEWCDLAQEVPISAPDDWRKRNCRYNKCLVLALQVEDEVGAFTIDEAMACLDQLGAQEDSNVGDPYLDAVTRFNQCMLTLAKIREQLVVSGGQLPLASTEQQAELRSLLSKLAAINALVRDALPTERDIINNAVQFSRAEILFHLGEYGRADSEAHLAASAYAAHDVPCRQVMALQIASQAMRALGDVQHARVDIDEALTVSIRCGALGSKDRAALVLSRAALMIVEDPQSGPEDAMDFLWNHADERHRDPVFQRQIINGMFELRRDLLDKDPRYWPMVEKLARELGLAED